MFEVNGSYANRKGNYTVLSINGSKMTVRYENGTEATLGMAIQERIWVNIDAERQVEAAKTGKRPRRAAIGVNFYIKTVSISEENDLNLPGLRQRLAAAEKDQPLKAGDRLIYYAVEPELFIAVATITAKAKKGKAIDFGFSDNPKTRINVFPIDVDAHIENMEVAIPVNASELESLPSHRETIAVANQYFVINEDDFELLAELVMEVGESEEAAVDDSDTEPEEELIMDGMDD